MDGTLNDLNDVAEIDNAAAVADDPAIEKASGEYLGRWNRLVSSTNWEKGRIISEWREALLAAGAPAASCTDDTWARHVGNVTPQHTGRLRRVYQRFAASREAYPGLFWSHFQAALDWDDAEMWLEGAVQNDWSIAVMQSERSRTLGALVEENVEAVGVEIDEDAVDAPFDLPSQNASAAASSVGEETPVADADESVDFAGPSDDMVHADASETYDEEPAAVRPFENLPELPADLRDAFDSFKLAIVHHRLAGWQEVGIEGVLVTLDALRQLALAPAE
jgi:hypothetical protein